MIPSQFLSLVVYTMCVVYIQCRDEIIKFSWERTFKPPAIPSIIPLSHCVNHQLEKFALKSTWDSQLHMNAARDEQGETKLYVTKVGPTKRRNTTWFEDILWVFFILRYPFNDFLS